MEKSNYQLSILLNVALKFTILLSILYCLFDSDICLNNKIFNVKIHKSKNLNLSIQF